MHSTLKFLRQSAWFRRVAQLLEVAAYTTAVDGSRNPPRPRHQLPVHRVRAPNVALYQVSIAQVLGDSGTAI